MVFVSNILKLLSIAFFRYDLVQYKSEIKGLVIWKPFFLSIMIIGIGPTCVYPAYTFDFYTCISRNTVFDVWTSIIIQITITLVFLAFIVYVGIISKIISNNKQGDD